MSSSLHKQLIKTKLPPLYPGSSGFGGRKIHCRRDYTPSSWDKYFDSYKDVDTGNGNNFRIYLKGNSGPLLFMLHGGGYSGLSWSLFASSISQLVECQIAALDIRGHGETHCTDDDDLSAETLSNDIGAVINALYKEEDPPPVVLVGHSMGGAIAVHAVHNDLVPTVIGLVVIDVVEGTAMDALQSMQSFLRGRPPSFPSLPNAIEWCVRSGQVRNVESAKVSMPGQLKNVLASLQANSASNDQCAIREVHLQAPNDERSQFPAPRQVAPADSILEEDEEGQESKQFGSSSNTSEKQCADDEDVFKRPGSVPNATKYVWRIELSKTEKYWAGWFEGLSNMFLATSVPKLLLLAGVDRLDRDLTIGQMQGKFQMQVLPQCGHAVHEDDPEKVAEAIATFLVRNKFATALQDFQRPFAGC